MQVEAKITSKGQITIPASVRKELGVRAGDKIRFEKNSGQEITVRPVRKDSRFAKFRGMGNPGVGSGREAINRYIREMRGFDPDDPSVE